jgi:hypothetical protein
MDYYKNSLNVFLTTSFDLKKSSIIQKYIINTFLIF